MKYITIYSSKGNKRAIVDDSDFSELVKYRWSLSGRGYAARATSQEGTIYMHRLLLDAPKGKQVDHINGNKLDNRKNNLRLCNNFENNVHRGLRKNNTSGYKGVIWNKQRRKWAAIIRTGSKRLWVCFSDDPIEAAKAYNEAAKKYHGEFAVLNRI